MTNLSDSIFSIRPTVIVELPLTKYARILHPEQVILKIDSRYFDLGAFCYALRSQKRRKHRKPSEVVLSSLLKQRPRQILQLIKALSSLVTDGGKRLATVRSYAEFFSMFLNWADADGRYDCLSGGEVTRRAYSAWTEDTHERYRRQEFGEDAHNQRLVFISQLLEATTGLDDLHRGIRIAKRCQNSNGTDPLAPHDFAHAVALNQAIFDGLCDLVLERRLFPYKLVLPATLNWSENHLWLFPTAMWRLPPHKWGAERERLNNTHWAYDYAAGCLANPDQIAHRYAAGSFPSSGRKIATKLIARAQAKINAANCDHRNWVRRMLGMIAHNAFLFLFFCNTGANESVVREIETDGTVDTTTNNQQFRSIKFRAGSKPVKLSVPATFIPSLRRFMELRRFLLADMAFPYMFFTLGCHRAKPPRQVGLSPLQSLYQTLLAIDPKLPLMACRKLRASVADWYQRHHDASITAKVLQNSEQIAQKRYDAGSATNHHEELSMFLNSVSEAARRQRVIPIKTKDIRPLEEGGACANFGHPEALADSLPVKPNCKDSQGCLFCSQRVLVACEEDARKVASAAFVMEQVILGPRHEEVLRPLIVKCDQDLEKIATFLNCRAMVDWVRTDVFENGKLTPFFADKYQLFLELGVVA